MRTTFLLTITFIFFATLTHAQPEMNRQVDDELKMHFPSIYFRHNSTEYSQMPYSVDSCFKFISANIKDLNSYPVWRDSSENEHLTQTRIKKLRSDLSKYTPTGKIHFQSMSDAQKVSQQTIRKCIDSVQKQFLFSLNSVLDVSGAINRFENKQKSHILRPRLFCPNCWKNGFHLDRKSRTIRKMARRAKQTSEKGK